MPLSHLKDLEVSLHQHDVRTNSDKLKELIHPEFIEIGYSGKTYNFKSMMDRLLSEPVSEPKVWSQDYELNEYARDVIQIIYQSANIDKNGNLSRYAKRTSIWVNESDLWQMKFHQATPVGAFSKTDV